MLMVITQSSQIGDQADDFDFCTNRHVAHPRVANPTRDCVAANRQRVHPAAAGASAIAGNVE
jgi:hypothetical protein